MTQTSWQLQCPEDNLMWRRCHGILRAKVPCRLDSAGPQIRKQLTCRGEAGGSGTAGSRADRSREGERARPLSARPCNAQRIRNARPGALPSYGCQGLPTDGPQVTKKRRTRAKSDHIDLYRSSSSQFCMGCTCTRRDAPCCSC